MDINNNWNIFLTIYLFPYLIIFRGGFSNEMQDWSNFGTYLSGISSLLNVIVFVSITILIQSINDKNKSFELQFNSRKEVFSRFLNSYESLLCKLFSLKTTLAQIKLKSMEVNLKVLLDFYESIKTTEAITKTYVFQEEEQIQLDIKAFIDSFYELIGICSTKDSPPKDEMNRLLKQTIKEIDKLVEELSTKIQTHLKTSISNQL
jgi:hypothetical protein